MMTTPDIFPSTEPTTEFSVPAEPLAAAIGHQALETTVSIPSIEDFRVHETLGERALRLYSRVVHGRYAHGSHKPNKYDADGYVAGVAPAIETLVAANENEMPPALYDAADQATISLQTGTQTSGMYYYEYTRNQANGARDLGVLRAITRNPSFALTDPGRAVSILRGLGEHEPSVAKGMFTTYDPELNCTVLRPEIADKALDVATALIGQDGLWQKTPPNKYGYQRAKAEWTLSEISDALGAVAERKPMESFDARINMLVRNVTSGVDAGRVTFNLVYSFKSAAEKTALADLARDPEATNVARSLATDILEGAWDRTYWAL